MGRQARERFNLRDFVVKPEDLKPGLPVRVIANGGMVYQGLVDRVMRTRAVVSFLLRSGQVKRRTLPFSEIYRLPDGAEVRGIVRAACGLKDFKLA